MAWNIENEWLKNLEKKLLKRSSISQLVHWLFLLEIPENPPNKCFSSVSAPVTYDITRHRPQHAVSLLCFSENLKKGTPQNHKKYWVKSLHIRSCCGPYFHEFHIRSKWRKMQTRIVPNTDTFYTVKSWKEMENMEGKLSYDLWISLPDMKVILKQLSEMVLKNSCP